jgi:16S rRNA (guanine(1405)-N(7))-methyltransferase
MADAPGHDPLATIVEALAEEAIADYRIDLSVARELIAEALRHDRKLREAAAKESDLDRLRRTRAFRDARGKVRKKVYYTLRQYKGCSPSGTGLSALIRELRTASGPDQVERTAGEILALHSSTRERLASREAFDRHLLAAIGRPRTVLDVGSGVYPLMFPFGALGEDLDLYLALDRDAEVIEALRAFAAVRPESRLAAFPWDLTEGWGALSRMEQAARVERFDVAFLFKVVPVVARQEPGLLETLARTPARRLVVSGSRVALAKQAAIERRERGVLERWIGSNGFEVIGEFAVEEELAYVLEPGAPD